MNTSTSKKIRWPVLIAMVGGTLILGAIGALIGGIDGFDSLIRPTLTPPAWVFPVVWNILYVLMGVAAYLVRESGDLDQGGAVQLYWIQLLINILWPLLFFRLQWRLFAFFWLLLLLGLIVWLMVRFRRIVPVTCWLLLPYLLWTLFASYLNFGFYILNA